VLGDRAVDPRITPCLAPPPAGSESLWSTLQTRTLLPSHLRHEAGINYSSWQLDEILQSST